MHSLSGTDESKRPPSSPTSCGAVSANGNSGTADICTGPPYATRDWQAADVPINAFSLSGIAALGGFRIEGSLESDVVEGDMEDSDWSDISSRRLSAAS